MWIETFVNEILSFKEIEKLKQESIWMPAALERNKVSRMNTFVLTDDKPMSTKQKYNLCFYRLS